MIAKIKKKAREIYGNVMRNRLYGFKKRQLLREIQSYGRKNAAEDNADIWAYNFYQMISEDKKWMVYVHEKLWRGFREDEVREIE